MKKSTYLYVFALMILFSACFTGTETVEENLAVEETKSTYYKEVVKASNGDFSGFTLGKSLSETEDVLASEYLSIEEDDFLLFKISDTYTITEYSLYFTENNKLSEINMDTKVYDEEDNYDTSGAIELFNEIKEEFMTKFGSKYLEEVNNDNIIMFWNKGPKQIQLILDNSEVHVYIESSEIE